MSILLDTIFKCCLVFHCAGMHNLINPLLLDLHFQLFTMINSPGINNGFNYFLK